MRALRNNFDPYLQTYNRLDALSAMGHQVDKAELIILGGTWSFYPEKYPHRSLIYTSSQHHLSQHSQQHPCLDAPKLKRAQHGVLASAHLLDKRSVETQVVL